MSGYINGKVEIWYGDNPPSNQNVLWQKRIVTNNVESTVMYEFNNNTGLWQVHNAEVLSDYAPINNAEFTGTLKLNGVDVPTSDLDGTNYVMVYGVGTPSENAAELQAAYNEAKKMPRYLGSINVPFNSITFYMGQTYSIDNGEGGYWRVVNQITTDKQYDLMSESEPIDQIVAENERTTVIVAPGEYNFGASAFVVDASGINIVSLTGNSDVIISSTEENSDFQYIYGIKVIADNTLVKGIDCKTNTFYIANNLNNLICEYCKGGNKSFGGAYGTASGKFNDCTGGDESFGSGGTASGTFNNCTGGNYSFGGGVTASGTFNNCTGGNYSFGGDGGTASGKFNNCTGGNYSFGGNGGTASGTFSDCKGGHTSFGGSLGIASGTFNDCTGGNYSFGGNGGVASGTFSNCTGGGGSFGGGDNGVIETSARLYYTRLTSGTFSTPMTGGRLILCIDGNNNIVTI